MAAQPLPPSFLMPSSSADAHISATQQAASSLNAAVDDPEEWPSFGRALMPSPTPSNTAPESPSAAAAQLWDSQISLQGMYCATCALTIEDAVRRVPGVQRVEVSAAAERARVVWDAQRTRPSVWFAAIAAAGYRAYPAHDVDARLQRQAQSRRALWRWLLATFCMMQVMMYAWPSYEQNIGGGDLTLEMETLLRWASWVISVPMLVLACGPFFSAAWRDLKARRVSMDLPVALGLLITFIISTLGTFDPSGLFGREVFYDSLTMFAAFLLAGRWLEMRLRERTAGALEAVLNRLPASVERQCADGSFERVALRRVQAGQVLRVKAGESFPADGELIEGSTAADEALLTGESHPIEKTVGDAVAAGSFNLRASVLMRVRSLGADTRFGQILALMQDAATQKPRLAQMADKVAGPFLVGILVLAALAAAYWWDAANPGHALMVAATVLIVTCPCALSLATPVAMLTAAGTLARQGVLTRRLQALESLAGINTLVFDKTGTLTHATLKVARVHWGDVPSPKGADPGQVIEPKMHRLHATASIVAELPSVRAAVSGSAAPHPWQGLAGAVAAHSVHPASRAVAAFDAEHAARWQVLTVQEIAGAGLWADVAPKAAPHIRLRLRLGSAAWAQTPAHDEIAAQDGLSDKAVWLSLEDCRIAVSDALANDEVHGVAQSPATNVSARADPGQVIGPKTPGLSPDAPSVSCLRLAHFALHEGLRGEAAEVVEALQRMGIAVHLLSGDAPQAVAQAARASGIAPERVRAQCSPADKLQAIAHMQSHGARVGMVGDGLNDGPVLAGADASFAFGAAVPLACAQSDFVVPADDLRQVLRSVQLARKTLRVVRQNLLWAAAYNVVSVPFAAAGLMPAWLAGLGMAASSLLVVLNAARLAVVPR